MSEPKIKRLFIDIETCANIGWFWKAGYKLNIPAGNIIEEARIICASWKWQGDKKVFNAAWNAKQCDKTLVKKIVEVLNEADEIVYQNGDWFDLPWIKGRALFHRIPTLPRYHTFDTLKKLRSNFRLNSNRLDYVQKWLGGKGKFETGGIKLWEDVHLKNNRKELKKMIKYCDQDVRELEELFETILPYVPHNTHVGVVQGGEKSSCVNCGSSEVGLHHTKYTAAGAMRRQMKCRDCGSHYTISNTEYKKLLKSKAE